MALSLVDDGKMTEHEVLFADTLSLLHTKKAEMDMLNLLHLCVLIKLT